jgi:hypothetical protein
MPELICVIDALTPEERLAQGALRAQLDAAVEAVRELPDGYEFVYRPGSEQLAAAARWLPLEQRCCPHFDFALLWHAERGQASLRLTGGPGVKAFIAGQFPVDAEAP